MKTVILFFLVCMGAHAADDLEKELQGLSLPENQLPVTASEEKLYSVQTRYSSLDTRFELSAGGAHNFVENPYLDSNQVNGALRFHIAERFNLGVSGAYVFNQLSPSGKRLYREERILADFAFTKYRADFTLGSNLFYGKFRLSLDEVFYFDLYADVGVAAVWQNTGRRISPLADVGFAFWLGKWGVARLGVKNLVFKEKRQKSESLTYHGLAHLDIGVLL